MLDLVDNTVKLQLLAVEHAGCLDLTTAEYTYEAEPFVAC